MLRKILTEPDPILRKKCEPLEKVDTETKKLMDDMLETMYAAPGIGLAAIQVGVPKRIIVLDIDWKDKYIGRKKHPIKEAECVKFNSRNEVIDIGKISKNKNDVSGEFIGMIKLSKKGSKNQQIYIKQGP